MHTYYFWTHIIGSLSRLSDVVQSDGRLYLVFEFVDKDLKKYFEATDGALSPQLIKVKILFYCTKNVLTHLFLVIHISAATWIAVLSRPWCYAQVYKYRQ